MAKKKNKATLYPALKYAINNNPQREYTRDYEEHILPLLKKITHVPDNFNMNRSDFIKSVLSRDFMTAHADDKNYLTDDCKMLYNLTVKNMMPLMHILGYSDDVLAQLKLHDNLQSISVQSEIRDLYVEHLLINDWACNKQVIKPDPVFAKHLIATDKLDIDASNVRLPFTTFFLDLDACNKDNFYGDIYGTYVDVRDTYDDILSITLFILDRQYRVVSSYMSLDKRHPRTIDTSELRDDTSFTTAPLVTDKSDIQINSKRLTTLVFQLLCYMQVREPDMNTSQNTKTYYRKPVSKDNIKDKYSEICEHEIGIRIGKKITNDYNAMQKAKEHQTAHALRKNRKPPVPHFRSAHWAHYWTGKGRTNCELRWIGPTFVCGDYDSSKNSGDVIIHPVE